MFFFHINFPICICNVMQRPLRLTVIPPICDKGIYIIFKQIMKMLCVYFWNLIHSVVNFCHIYLGAYCKRNVFIRNWYKVRKRWYRTFPWTQHVWQTSIKVFRFRGLERKLKQAIFMLSMAFLNFLGNKNEQLWDSNSVHCNECILLMVTPFFIILWSPTLTLLYRKLHCILRWEYYLIPFIPFLNDS